MEIEYITEDIVKYIRQINRSIHKKHHELAQKYDLSLEQFHLLVHLDTYEENPTITDIAKRHNKAPNTISERISRLEERGLILKEKDKKDRRINRVIITKKGDDLLKAISYKASNEFVKNSLSDMDSKLVNQLVIGLRELSEKLD
ncbi:MarR family winged helix-turn-helix transcriptional regulator [Dethiothermospora halolimnae]|uniref:MarR family winged helix-turn-helix transcriptional regulator n=1 Tax=Dethiothermospora halolimnae TaxID=3114390 RepID=UPI003CCB9D12